MPWTFDPSILAGILLAAAAYAYFARPSRQSPAAPALFYGGLAVFAVALVSPLDALSDHYLLSAHMLQHILITMVGPPMLLAGLPRLPRLAAALRLALNPWVTVVAFNLVLIGWHFPVLYEATLHNENIHILEHLMFMGTALLFWWPVVGQGSRGEARLSPLMKVGYLAFAGVPPTVIGMTLALTPQPLYPFYAAASRISAWLPVMLDQQVAGVLMFGVGNLIYFVPASRNFFRAMSEPSPVTEADRAVR